MIARKTASTKYYESHTQLFYKFDYKNKNVVLKGKKILIGITGSIAAYKIIYLTRLLVKNGAEVQIVMTEAATKFVSPLVLSTLSKNKVLINLFDDDVWANHVALGRWADAMIIAPLSCNTLAKMAHGLCDNLLLAVYLSATCKVLFAPAMDEDMWHHPATQKNVDALIKNGNILLGVDSGELASGLTGEGRMMEPEKMLIELKKIFRKDDLKGQIVLITSGPTYELLDPVRFIANHSTGKMGTALAEAFYENGADVIFISGPSVYLPEYEDIKIIKVISADEMYEQAIAVFPQTTIAILAAAVADYTPIEKSEIKIKKNENEFTLTLKKTKDILKKLGKLKENQLVIGFALETNNEIEYANKKLKEKNADFIILNSLNSKNEPFGSDNNKVTILSNKGVEFESDLLKKSKIANLVIEKIKEKILPNA
ncbi:MAG: bifunctional phosphopantothenoylcysteine decarboxylase/phosphopantothenate--cysteine ligase CoaBC [Arachidicoccus sp.]|nr:bifunctional phosphopantothenoylcysteine decarboxylase/phosphopantothenate--cysteine ligase CoaBC [Arachidicoccus sp.]